MRAIVGAVTSLFLVATCFVACRGTSQPKAVNEVVEKRPFITASDLSQKFLEGFDTSSRGSIKAKLDTQDSLTLDGTTLIVGDVGANRTVTLACYKLKMINGARIVTNGNQLNLYAMEMEFNNAGGVDSFLGDALNAKPDAQGANGGRVEIYSLNSVYGSLRVSLPGQNGGAGSKGATGPGGPKGPRGSDGSDRLLDCGSGGGDGGQGGAGGQGYPGNDGKDGGNGGDLLLKWAAATDYNSKFPYNALPGTGGQKGQGGDGGPGGPGGDGGSGSGHCSGGHPGPQGLQGQRGVDGKDGHAGTSTGKREVK